MKSDSPPTPGNGVNFLPNFHPAFLPAGSQPPSKKAATLPRRRAHSLEKTTAARDRDRSQARCTESASTAWHCAHWNTAHLSGCSHHGSRGPDGSSGPSPARPSGEDPFTTCVSHSMDVVREGSSIVFLAPSQKSPRGCFAKRERCLRGLAAIFLQLAPQFQRRTMPRPKLGSWVLIGQREPGGALPRTRCLDTPFGAFVLVRGDGEERASGGGEVSLSIGQHQETPPLRHF